MKEFTHRIAAYEDIPTIEVLMELSINKLLGPLLSAEQELQTTQIGKATDPVFWVPLIHTISLLFTSF